MIVLCEYAFVLDARAKSSLMQLECVLQMRVSPSFMEELRIKSLSSTKVSVTVPSVLL